MLQSIHDKSKGWVAYVIVAIICIPFVFWGINEYVGGGSKLVIAEVNGQEISAQLYRRALQQRKQQMREMLGDALPIEILEGPEIKQAVVNDLIREALLRQFSEEKGFRVGDAQLVSEIQKLPIFQEDGAFSAERYSKLLEAQRLSKAAFEQDLRAGMELDQFEAAISSSAFLTARELRSYLQLKAQQRDISYALVRADALQNSVIVTDEEAREHYQAFQKDYKSEELVKLEYIILDPKLIEDNVLVSDDDARALFDQESERYTTGESRSISQILIKLGSDSNAAAENADAAYQRLKSNEAFAVVAGDDSLAAGKGGDLGAIFRGDLAQDVESVIFSLGEGEFSKPIKTAQGFSIVKVNSITASVPRPFGEVIEQVKEEARRREADALFSDMANQLLSLSYENPASLDAPADALGVKKQFSGFVSRRGASSGIASDPKVLAAAFNEDVLVNGNNSDALTLADERQVVIRIAEHKLADVQSFDEVRGDVIKLLQSRKVRELSRVRGEELLAGAKLGGALESLLAATGEDFVGRQTLDRSSSSIAPNLLDSAFKMPHPAGAPEFVGLQMASGDYVVIQLDKVLTPDVSTTDSYATRSRVGLSRTYGTRDFDAIYRALAAEADIEVFTHRL